MLIKSIIVILLAVTGFSSFGMEDRALEQKKEPLNLTISLFLLLSRAILQQLKQLLIREPISKHLRRITCPLYILLLVRITKQ